MRNTWLSGMSPVPAVPASGARTCGVVDPDELPADVVAPAPVWAAVDPDPDDEPHPAAMSVAAATIAAPARVVR